SGQGGSALMVAIPAEGAHLMAGTALQRAHLRNHLGDGARIVGGAFLQRFEKYLVTVRHGGGGEIMQHVAPRCVDSHRTIEILRRQRRFDMAVQLAELGQEFIFGHFDIPIHSFVSHHVTNCHILSVHVFDGHPA
ncbi:MAG: hypothetical protein VXB94_10880, partial [Rhodobiaceae bacterium]